MKFISYIFNTTELGFYYLSLILSKGFFFYFYLLASILYKLIPIKLFDNLKKFFKEKQEDSVSILMVILLFLACVCVYTYFYNDNEIKHVDEKVLNGEKVKKKKSNDINLYRKYSDMDINSVSFDKLNKKVVLWLMVDGTSINYPVVQGNDNDFYLNHDINGDLKSSGWVFMDYRNDKLNDDNTIIYGHNLANKTAFGSLNNLFEEKWFNNSNHLIVIRMGNKKYVYEVFSVYEIEPEIYYLQNNFYKKEYNEFIETIKSRSKYDFNVEVNNKSKILTLSTCTSDNKNRRVVHAVKIK